MCGGPERAAYRIIVLDEPLQDRRQGFADALALVRVHGRRSGGAARSAGASALFSLACGALARRAGGNGVSESC